MKRKMVSLCFFICLFATGNVPAERTTFKEQTENWLRSSAEASGSGYSGENDEDLIGNETPSPNPSVPLHDAFLFLGLLAVGYGVILNRKKSVSLKNAK
jgi:hypothetical protein